MKHKVRSSLTHVHNFYTRFEHPISSLSLIGGFIFNIFALTRVDEFWENFWIVIHLLIVAVAIILLNRDENEGAKSITKNVAPSKLHFWLVTVLQFTFGGLFGTFIVFYFRSAVITVAWPFFVILGLAFIANERFKHHFTRLGFQICFFFFSVYLFFIFFIPVITHEISPRMFLLAGAASLVVLCALLLLLQVFARERFRSHVKSVLAFVFGIVILVNCLYFLHLIPPLPLALHDSGVYHSVSRTKEGTYTVMAEPSPYPAFSLERFRTPLFHTKPGGLVYAYSAVYAPKAFTTPVIHEWQHYDSETKKWRVVSTVQLTAVGGREGGFRTYSIQAHLPAGKTRVNIRTESGQLIGRLHFNLIYTEEVPELLSEIKY